MAYWGDAMYLAKTCTENQAKSHAGATAEITASGAVLSEHAPFRRSTGHCSSSAGPHPGQINAGRQQKTGARSSTGDSRRLSFCCGLTNAQMPSPLAPAFQNRAITPPSPTQLPVWPQAVGQEPPLPRSCSISEHITECNRTRALPRN